MGWLSLNIPRDRNGEFEPAIIAKKQNRIAGLDKKILSLYAKGMSLADIKQQLYELYETDIGVDLSGRKDILGLWISENEGAKF